MTPITQLMTQGAEAQYLAGRGTSLRDTSQQQDRSELKEVFGDFVGQTFYGQLLGAMRQTVGPPAYFHGGRAEEVFQGQLDQVIAERLSDASADQFTGPMFELFQLRRS